MIGWSQAFNAEGMKRMARYFDRIKAEDDAAKAKAAAPCDLPRNSGLHDWQYLRGEIFGGLHKACNCGARG
jgi:hypothetical protein